jgi:hypothetical protein
MASRSQRTPLTKSDKAVNRAIGKGEPVEEPPIIGKPVVQDPPDEKKSRTRLSNGSVPSEER